MKLISTILAASALLLGGNTMAAEKPEIVLVHGAFADASVWQGVTAKLKADGYQVTTINMPGRPSAPQAPDQVSLDLYKTTVLKALEKSTKPVVLVGHSFAGITISAVAEAAPEKVKTLVYVAAYLPRNGESLLSLAQQDPDAKIGPHLQINKEKGMAVVEYAARADLFANDGPAQLRAVLPDLIVDEPLAPLATPVPLSADRFGKVDKAYVHTTLDQVISPALQTTMVTATPVRFEATLKTGHLPFLINPNGLAEAIEQASK
ncbi:alpha/beta fold hydrolase [Rhodoferax ferrireducens]|uniref:alpha/beta fold hydrolase n=1 Tax=Rhodoferax ferrireducens TaxID=192843 RepID=UPI000E0CF6EE|nr:alpha/beta fold hydrolase [Rhodoferax ferrireducens]